MRITDSLQEQKYVAYLDVLGFKELVQQKGEKLNVYYEIIDKALSDIKIDKAEIDSQLVSDSTILACRKSNEQFGLLLRAVQTIQSRCALQNIWLRGAITLGEIHFDQQLKIVVGNGLSQAYLMESQEKFPRIIINPRIIQDFKTRQEFIEKYNKRGKPPLVFEPNFQTNFIENDAVFVAFLERILDSDMANLETIYNHVKSELYAGQQNYQKYLWLKNYFTEALSNYLSFLRSKHILRTATVEEQRTEATCEFYINSFKSL